MVMAADDSKPIQEVLSCPILFADRVIKSALEAESFKVENSDLADKVTDLSQHLLSAARLTSAVVYDRPIRRVAVDVTKVLDRAFTLARKCRHKRTSFLHHVLSITTAADFKRVSSLLDSSLADINWVLSIFNQDAVTVTLPPFASTDPFLAWVWAAIAPVHSGRAEAARHLADLAASNGRVKKIIVEENGIPPLLKMLKGTDNVDAQSAAASALCNLADDDDCVRVIVEALGVQIIVKALYEVPMSVQVTLAVLISRMLEVNTGCQEEFGKENVMRPLVALLGVDVDLGEFKEATNSQKMVNSSDSPVEFDKQMTRKGDRVHVHSLSGNKQKQHCNKKDKETAAEPPEVKSMLKKSCTSALWRLAKGSLSNSKKITETKALLLFAKIIENEEPGELKMNCLKVVMELAAVAERESDLKRAAFKLSLTAAKVVLNQLLRVIDSELDADMLTLAIKAVGCLASMFSAKEKRIIKSLVMHLAHRNPDIAAEAAMALCKFLHDKNYNKKEHSQAIIEFGGVPKIMKLMASKDRVYLHELVLLCKLAMNAGNSKAFEQARTLGMLQEGAARHAVVQNPALRELFTKAIHQLTIYQAGAPHHVHGQV